MKEINREVMDVALEKLDFPLVTLDEVIYTIMSYNGFSFSEKHKESIMNAILKDNEDWTANFHETIEFIVQKYEEGLDIYTINTKCIKIYGRCDDWIKFESTHGWEGEYPFNNIPSYKVELLDGTIFSIRYDSNEIWRIEVIREGLHFYKFIKSEERIDSDEAYSDILILKNFEENPIEKIV